MKNLRSLLLLGLIAASCLSFAGPVTRLDEVSDKIAAVANMYKSDLPGAIKDLEAFYATHQDNADVQSWLGFLYLRNSQADMAVPVLEKAQAKKPGDLEVIINLGNAYTKTGANEKAIAQYKMAVAKKDDMYEPWYNLGNLYLAGRDYDSAIASYQKAISLKSDTDAYSYNNIGICHEAKGDLSAAAAAYEIAAKAQPEQVLFSRNAGLAYRKLKNEEKATPYLEAACKGDNPDSAVCAALSMIYAKNGRGADALALMAKLESAQGDKADYWYNVGVIRQQTNDVNGAMDAYKKALDISPDDADTNKNYGLLLYKAGKYEEALPMFDKTYKNDPSDNNMMNCATCRAKLGDLKGAAGLWKKFLAKNPSRSDVRLDYANAQWQMGDKEGAKSNWVTILTNDRSNVVAMNGLGLYYYSQDKLAEAEQTFRKAIATKGTFREPYNNLAVVLERQNKRPEALKVLKQAVKLFPDYEVAKRNLERMEAASSK